MEMPHGIRIKYQREGQTLRELTDFMSEKSMTGYAVVHPPAEAGQNIVKGTIAYDSGVPVMGFISEGKTDRADPGLTSIEAMISRENAVVEIIQIRDHHLQQVLNAGNDFVIHTHEAAPDRPSPELHRPRESRTFTPGTPRLPGSTELKGHFIKAASIAGIRHYFQGNSKFTGHAIFVKKNSVVRKEYHLLVIKGTVVASYSESENLAGQNLYDRALDEDGVIELYSIEENEIDSLLEKYPHISIKTHPGRQADESTKPAHYGLTKHHSSVLSGHRHPQDQENIPATNHATKPPAKHSYTPENNLAVQGRISLDKGGKAVVVRISEIATPHHLDTFSDTSSGADSDRLYQQEILQEQSGNQPEHEPDLSFFSTADEEVEYFRKIEREFSTCVDDLLDRFNLSHLKLKNMPNQKDEWNK